MKIKEYVDDKTIKLICPICSESNKCDLWAVADLFHDNSCNWFTIILLPNLIT